MALSVVASTDVYGDIARVIGGDRVRVTSLIDSPDKDPHTFQATAQDALAVATADIVIQNGGGYDDFMTGLEKTGGRARTVLDAVTISGRTAPPGGELNEHVWYDFAAMSKVATALGAALARARPTEASSFTAAAADLVAEVNRLQGTEAAIKSTADGRGVAVTEPVPLYLTEACGLVNRTPAEFSRAVEEGSDVPPLVLDRTLALFRERAVAVLLYNRQTSGPQTDAVTAAARAAGIPAIGVSETLPAGKTYLTWMAANLAALRAAVVR